MEVNKNEWEILQNAINEWEKNGSLSPLQSRQLRESISVRRSERLLLARYFFIISISCALLAFGAIFIDEKLIEKLKQYFSISNIIISGITGAVSVAWYWYVYKRKSRLSAFTYEVDMVLGALCSLTCITYIFKDISLDPAHIGLLVCATIILLALSVLLISGALWGCAIIALLLWYGAFSGAASHNNLFLGMNYALRYTAFGLLLIAFSFIQSRISLLRFTWRFTYSAGLLLFLLAMWGVSIFGNYNTLDEWWKVRQSHEMVYGIVFGLVAVLVLFLGIKYKDEYTRDMGVLFLLLNLYTRYFEYFWDTMNKGIFFLVLAITFGILGRWLERKKRGLRKPVSIKPLHEK